jgi:hypothetical protein
MIPPSSTPFKTPQISQTQPNATQHEIPQMVKFEEILAQNAVSEWADKYVCNFACFQFKLLIITPTRAAASACQ